MKLGLAVPVLTNGLAALQRMVINQWERPHTVVPRFEEDVLEGYERYNVTSQRAVWEAPHGGPGPGAFEQWA